MDPNEIIQWALGPVMKQVAEMVRSGEDDNVLKQWWSSDTWTTMMARFVSVSSPHFPFSFRELPPSSSTFYPRRVEVSDRRFSIKCSSSEPEEGVDSAPSLSSSSSSSSSSSTSKVPIDTSSYNLYTVLGGIGMLDTAYLTYLKLTGSDVFCPVGGGACGDVLNSDYALVFGVSLPVIGFVMYGLVTALSAQLRNAEGNLPFGISKTNGRFALFAATTTMASASAYFVYILSTKLSGSSCLYCLVSAFLSFSLFFLSLKDVKLQEIQQVAGLQICLAIIVVASLSASYSTAQPIPSRSGDIELPYYSTEITTSSSPYAIALAKHLNSIGAKMYGAFWCSHCLEQKEMFGREAAKLLNYVECFPQGYKKGVQIFKACSDARIEGFPTWMINGQVLSGEIELAELAEMSGFTLGQANEANQLK